MSAIAHHHPHVHSHDHEHHELVIRGLTVHYRNVLALENVSLATSCGTRLALIGPNGAGKSTLLKAIAGLVPRRSGSIAWRGSPVRQWSKEFAYLPQREEVDWSFPITVRGLIEMGRYPQLGWWRRFSNTDDAAVDLAIEALDLGTLQQRQIRELSGGQQQRAFIARAIAQEAHVLLLDEPFSGLDRNASVLLTDLLARLSSEGRLIIASHHDLATVNRQFDQVLLLRTRTLAFGTPEQVLTPSYISEAFHDGTAPFSGEKRHSGPVSGSPAAILPATAEEATIPGAP